MLKQLAVAISLTALVAATHVTHAQSLGCINTYYQTHDGACLDRIVAIAGTPASQAHPNPAGSSLVGFFAALFAQDAAARQRILADHSQQSANPIYLAALVRAGLTEEAQRYADAVGGAEVFRRYREIKQPTIDQLVPSANAGDNDMLIGAYLATGNQTFITHVLDNYLSADDVMAGVALRDALVTSRFGTSLTPPGRKSAMNSAICAKYSCKQDRHDFLRVQTLASAFWAIQSLAQHDASIRQCLVEFFQLHPRLNAILRGEENGFSNYLTMLTAYAGIKDNAGINEALAIYEELGTPADAMAAMQKSPGAITVHKQPVPH